MSESDDKILRAIILIADGLYLYMLEHDDNWRSWKKDEGGLCSFPVEEGKAGWIRVSKAGSTSGKRMKRLKEGEST